MTKKYYEAYDERYKTAHSAGVSWFGENATPIVSEVIEKYIIDKSAPMLELGCGEGRDAVALLNQGFNLLATDISPEAVRYCKERFPEYSDSFDVLDCLGGGHNNKYDFIFAVAVIHMLVDDSDRERFYRFIYEHLNSDGIALICSMGDGKSELKSDASRAFELRKRQHSSGEMLVAATSCRTR